MYRLMIVDDEPTIVEGIRDSINWPEYGILPPLTALNGIEALALIQETPPDIVIADIKMPEMDGLAFSAHVRQAVPHAKIIILSAFEQFDYAKRAIELGVTSYLVKPVKRAAILDETLKAARALDAYFAEQQKEQLMISEYAQTMSSLLEYAGASWLFSTGADAHDIRETFAAAGFRIANCSFGCVVCLLEPKQAADACEMDQTLFTRLGGALDSVFLPGGSTVKILGRQDELILLYSSNMLPAEALKALNDLAAPLQAMADNSNARLTLGFGTVFSDFDQLRDSYLQALKEVDRRAIFPREELPRAEKGNFQALNMRNLLTRYKDLLLSGKEEDATQLVQQEIFGVLRARGAPYSFVRLLYHQLLAALLSVLWDCNVPLEDMVADRGDLYRRLSQERNIDSMNRWFLALQAELLQAARGQDAELSGAFIKKVQEYIHTHISSNVSLADVAEHMALSPSYLSRLFRKKTGISFIEYVKNAKMDRSKELLRSTNLKVYEICDCLGYQSLQYFTTLFKNTTGMTPLEYKQKFE